ncbi:hypothetical protein ACLIYM_12340 [Streptomyces fenghuangensis]|uniref:Secreted protein n=1 Tax=Streptomyces chitinivorans TaxID=1257027 RepID=A0ABW7HN89_9ACTN|nr:MULTISPECIES: hypothetical protein [Streptomyces]MCG3041739.1 hypothetical protein [Streptomyces sp. ICN903]MDH2410479.1 hypothetical protein [Streptomyces chitinivorans]
MSIRRRIVAGWAVLCLAGLAATSVLEAGPPAGTPSSPGSEPTPTDTYTVDCRELADDIAQARAEAERERREALDPSAAPRRPSATLRTMVVPRECADEFEDSGLMTR